MIKILANDGLHPDGKAMLEAAGFQVDTEKVPQEQLADVLPQYDVLIVRSATKVRRELIDACPNLKIIARAGVGLDNIDVDYAKQRGIVVYNTPGASSRAVAELVFGHLFALVRMLHLANREMPQQGDTAFKELKKKYAKGIQLGSKTLGIIGAGRIGQEVARMGLGLGMRVLAADIVVDEAHIALPVLGLDQAVEVHLHTVPLDELLAQSDFISLHVPFTGAPLIDDAAFAKMKRGVYIVNAARGGVIDEEALLRALDSGQVAGAGLDVFENEPTPRRELLQHPKISVSPHIGGSTQEAQSLIGRELAQQIIDFFKK